MARYCSILPVSLLCLAALSPTIAVSAWIACVLLANVAHVMKRRDAARAIIVATAAAAPLLWLFSVTPLAALVAATATALAPWRHEALSHLSALPRHERV